MKNNSPQNAEYLQTKLFGSLDGLRCLSIVAVLWHHASRRGFPVPILNRGFLGVDMFFVISGFLIVTLLLRERDRNGAISLRYFYARRTLRIFPIYYLLLALLAVIFGFVRTEGDMSVRFYAELPFYATYTSNWIHASTILGITWSLATEEQFYLFWPPVERFLGKFSIPLIVGWIAINQLVNFGVLDQPLLELGLDRGELEILQATFTPIALGVLLAHVLHRPNGFKFLARFFGQRAMAPTLAVITIAACNWPTDDVSGLPRLSIQLAMTGFLAATVIREDHHLRNPLGLAWVRRIGVVSYGMYLYHLLVLEGIDRLLATIELDSIGVRFLACIVGTWFVAELSFRFLERPVLRFKSRFQPSREGNREPT